MFEERHPYTQSIILRPNTVLHTLSFRLRVHMYYYNSRGNGQVQGYSGPFTYLPAS